MTYLIIALIFGWACFLLEAYQNRLDRNLMDDRSRYIELLELSLDRANDRCHEAFEETHRLEGLLKELTQEPTKEYSK